MSEIRVHCYAGNRADQRPSRFAIRNREYNVQEIDDQWYSPGVMYFRLPADDGDYYVLRHVSFRLLKLWRMVLPVFSYQDLARRMRP
jgi:hypothetical protein